MRDKYTRKLGKRAQPMQKNINQQYKKHGQKKRERRCLVQHNRKPAPRTTESRVAASLKHAQAQYKSMRRRTVKARADAALRAQTSTQYRRHGWCQGAVSSAAYSGTAHQSTVQPRYKQAAAHACK